LNLVTNVCAHIPVDGGFSVRSQTTGSWVFTAEDTLMIFGPFCSNYIPLPADLENVGKKKVKLGKPMEFTYGEREN
jgi:hypothetical protein